MACPSMHPGCITMIIIIITRETARESDPPIYILSLSFLPSSGRSSEGGEHQGRKALVERCLCIIYRSDTRRMDRLHRLNQCLSCFAFVCVSSSDVSHDIRRTRVERETDLQLREGGKVENVTLSCLQIFIFIENVPGTLLLLLLCTCHSGIVARSTAPRDPWLSQSVHVSAGMAAIISWRIRSCEEEEDNDDDDESSFTCGIVICWNLVAGWMAHCCGGFSLSSSGWT